MFNAIFGIIFGILIVAIVSSIFVALPVWLLWNALMPDLFALKHISFMQAWGLALLCSFLFKSYGSSSKKD